MRINALLHFVEEVVRFSFSLLHLLLTRILPLAAILAASLLLHIFRLIVSLLFAGPSSQSPFFSQPPAAEQFDDRQGTSADGHEEPQFEIIESQKGSSYSDLSKLVAGDAEKASPPHHQHAETNLHPSDLQSTVCDVQATAIPTARVIPIRPRVLPPSFSNIQRTLRGSSPSRLASAHVHSPIAYKKQSAGATACNSPSARSRSYENFMGKFRKHFLLDS